MKSKLLLLVLAGTLVLSGCAKIDEKGTENEYNYTIDTSQSAQVTLLDTKDMFSNKDLKDISSENGVVRIVLNGDSAECQSNGVEIKDKEVVIKSAGVYSLSGSYSGRILISADKNDQVYLLLGDCSIVSEDKAAIYVESADKVFVTSVSDNLLEVTGTICDVADNIDAAVFSKANITFNGTGSLSVTYANGNAITSKDNLKVTSGTINIQAGKHGLEGKDSVRICNSTISIEAGRDGIHSGNDEDDTKGYTYIESGNITINASDDGIHSDQKLVIAGGKIDIQKSEEGLEGTQIEIAGGKINISAKDDGINAAGGDGGEMMGGFGGRGFGRFDESSESGSDYLLIISGGELHVNADGDGLDSNGDMYIKGGLIFVDGPTNSGNGAIDHGERGKLEISGGSIWAIGASGMDETFDETSTQASVRYAAETKYAAGTNITIKDSNGKELSGHTSAKSFNSVVVSCPSLKVGEKYTLVIGSDEIEIELNSIVYSEGATRGGFGGPGDGGNFGKPGDFGDFNPEKGEFPGKGQRPDFSEDGAQREFPKDGRPQMKSGESGQK